MFITLSSMFLVFQRYAVYMKVFLREHCVWQIFTDKLVGHLYIVSQRKGTRIMHLVSLKFDNQPSMSKLLYSLLPRVYVSA